MIVIWPLGLEISHVFHHAVVTRNYMWGKCWSLYVHFGSVSMLFCYWKPWAVWHLQP